ncbi:MAG TPA: hypothetical protein GX517_00565 [Alicyclobacillus sp.]|nr:hypothetical protein [Alicyclobacillus sp.]
METKIPTMSDFLGQVEEDRKVPPRPPEMRTISDFLPEMRGKPRLPPQPKPPAYTILVDGEEKAAAASWREALGALEAAVRAVRTVPGRTVKVELRDREGRVLRTCYLPHWEGK